MKRPELHVVGDRFFAVLRTFCLECPRCGTVWGFGRRYHLSSVYNPRTQFFRCTNCSWRARLGIVAWPTVGGHSPERPVDTMPTPRQLLRMKQQATLGLWVEALVDGKSAAVSSGRAVNALSKRGEGELDPGPGEMRPYQSRGFTKKMRHQHQRFVNVEGGEGKPR